MAKDKRKFRVDEPPVIEGDGPSKRRLLRSGLHIKVPDPAESTKEETPPGEITEKKGGPSVGLNSLPTELKLLVAGALADQSSPTAARDLAALRLTSRAWADTAWESMLPHIANAISGKREQVASADFDTVAMLAGICAKNKGPDDAIETIVDVVWQRRQELANANSRQIAHFVSACSRGHEDTADWCLDLMADQVRNRREALVKGATDEELGEMHEGFELAEGFKEDPDYADRQAAWELVGEEISNRAAVHELQASPGRPELDNRDRGRSGLGD